MEELIKTPKIQRFKVGTIIAVNICMHNTCKGVFMKKILVGLVLSVALVGAVFASGAQDSVKVEGKLLITNGVPTITEKGKTWIIPSGPFYRIAWEQGIKAGDTVKIEGIDRGTREDCEVEGASLLQPAKVWVNGKELDLTATNGRGRGPMNGMGSGSRNRSDKRSMGNGFRNRQ